MEKAKKEPELVRINVFIKPNLRKATQLLAKRRGHTLSDIFRHALRDYVVAELRKEQADPLEPLPSSSPENLDAAPG